MAKGVASGYAPISCTVTTEKVFQDFVNDPADTDEDPDGTDDDPEDPDDGESDDDPDGKNQAATKQPNGLLSFLQAISQ